MKKSSKRPVICSPPFSPLNSGENGGVAGGVLWDPSNLSSGLIAWYDVSLLDWKTSVAQDYLTFNAAKVSQCDDRSGNLNHVTQGSGANQPPISTLGGQRFIDFEAGDFLDKSAYVGGNLSQPTSVCYLVLQNNSGGNPTTFQNDVAADAEKHLLWTNSGTSKITMFAGGSHVPTTRDADLVNYASYIAEFNEASSKFYYNDTDNSPVGDIGSSTWKGVRINTNFANGASAVLSLIDFVIINKTLSLDERQRIQGYFAWKLNTQYGDSTIVDNLAADHPYKAAAPTV